MIVDGEKYACDACIRGHRVSSCTHKDRKLNHVNKKGRPLTQCPHCRGLRKSRASHVKCDCGEAGHSRTSSVESAADTGCKCQTGKRCTCALKKEARDYNDIQKAHVTSTVSRPHQLASKPGMPPHNSDTAVPRIRAPVPPMHRLNSAPYDHRPHPYAIAKPRPLAESLHRSQRSLDGTDRGRTPVLHSHASTPHSLPLMQRQLSNPLRSRLGSPSPRRRPAYPSLRVDSQVPLPDFSASLDASTMHKAISPGNPARYSFHDLSDITIGGFSHQTPKPDPYVIGDEMRNSNWQSVNMRAAVDEHGYPLAPNPVTPSDVSVEYSLSSQYGISSSRTVSEPGDATAQPSDFVGRDLPYRSVPVNSSNHFQADLDIKAGMPAQAWAQYMPGYAASDPGAAFNTTGRMDNIGFNLEEFQGPDAGPGPFVDHSVEQYDLTMPVMSDEAVRDWVPNPAQMQDPNYNFEVPTHYPLPMMEGSYGWI